MLNYYNFTKIKNPLIYFAEKNGRTHCLVGIDHTIGLTLFDPSLIEHFKEYELFISEIGSSLPNIELFQEKPYPYDLCALLEPYQDQFLHDIMPTLKSFKLDTFPIQHILPCFLVTIFHSVLERFNPLQEAADLTLFNYFLSTGKTIIELPNKIKNSFSRFLLELSQNEKAQLCYVEEKIKHIKNYYASSQSQTLHFSESTNYFLNTDLTDENILQDMIHKGYYTTSFDVMENNQQWAKVFSEEHDNSNKTILFACGYEHLMKPRREGLSIPDLLKTMGFTITSYKPGMALPSLAPQKSISLTF